MARRKNVWIHQMITLAVAEKLSALESEEDLASRAGQARKNRFRKACSAECPTARQSRRIDSETAGFTGSELDVESAAVARAAAPPPARGG